MGSKHTVRVTRTEETMPVPCLFALVTFLVVATEVVSRVVSLLSVIENRVPVVSGLLVVLVEGIVVGF